MRLAIALLAGAVLVFGTVPLAWLDAEGSNPHIVIVIDPHHPSSSPVVQSRRCGPWRGCENGKDGIDVVDLLSGTAPAAPVTATVLTDEQCMPDRYGISHCLNALRLPDGSRITVRHSHDMNEYACLIQGNTVRLTPL